MEFRIDNRSGPAATITIELTNHEGIALGADAEDLAENLVTLLRGLVALRTGHWAADEWPVTAIGPHAEQQITAIKANPHTMAKFGLYHLLNQMNKLAARGKGITAAAIREHWTRGFTIGDLATALDVDARSTAQSRRHQVIKNPPTGWEWWAWANRPVAVHVDEESEPITFQQYLKRQAAAPTTREADDQ